MRIALFQFDVVLARITDRVEYFVSLLGLMSC